MADDVQDLRSKTASLQIVLTYTDSSQHTYAIADPTSMQPILDAMTLGMENGWYTEQ